MNDILVPVDPADLIDRIIALQLRSETAKDPVLQHSARGQCDVLQRLAARVMPDDDALAGLAAQLQDARADLADLVSDLHACEARKDYGTAFVALSQSMLATLSLVESTKTAINEHFAARGPLS
jgi:predicted deacylase